MIDETKTLQRFITGSALRGLVHGSRINGPAALMHDKGMAAAVRERYADAVYAAGYKKIVDGSLYNGRVYKPRKDFRRKEAKTL